MDAQKRKVAQAQRRKYRVRKAIRGTAENPRLSVNRTNLHIYAQLIDDEAQVTLAAASSKEKGGVASYGGNITAAKVVGEKLAAAAKAKGIQKAAFDRGSYRFHGRVKALAQAATAAGLVCTGPPESQKTKAVPPAGAAPAADAAPKKEKKEKKQPAKA